MYGVSAEYQPDHGLFLDGIESSSLAPYRFRRLTDLELLHSYTGLKGKSATSLRVRTFSMNCNVKPREAKKERPGTAEGAAHYRSLGYDSSLLSWPVKGRYTWLRFLRLLWVESLSTVRPSPSKGARNGSPSSHERTRGLATDNRKTWWITTFP